MDQKPGVKAIPQFKGEVLVCEDSELNQHVIKFHLLRLGFNVVFANDGEDGVKIVGDRIKTGEKPFDLILMDMYMPGMTGAETVGALAALGDKTPVIAITASTEVIDEENPGTYGFSGFLRKPIAEDELWSCLYRFFTPTGFKSVDEKRRADEESDRRDRLINGFLKRNRTTSADIISALKAGDVKLAHRLAHTLRGIAGLLDETALRDAAQAVERSLADESAERPHIKEQTEALDRELRSVLDKLEPLSASKKQPESEGCDFDREKAAAVFEQLRALLQADSAASLDFIGDLRKIPGTGALIERIEDYDFDLALEALDGISGFGEENN